MPNETRPSSLAPAGYPDTPRLSAALRAALGLPPSAELLLAGGAEGAIKAVTCALGGVQVVLEPGFGAAREVLGESAAVVRLASAGADYPAEAVALTARRREAVAVHLPSVMNPTAQRLDPLQVGRLLASPPHPLVVVDAVYDRPAPGGWLARAAVTDGLLAIGSVSKLGGAALRVGFCVGTEVTTARVRRCFPTHPVPASAIDAAVTLLLDEAGIEARLATRRRDTAALADALDAVGLASTRGEGWVLVEVGDRAAAVAAALRAEGHAADAYLAPPLGRHVRLMPPRADAALPLATLVFRHAQEARDD